MPDVPTVPKAELKRAFDLFGAVYTLLWSKAADQKWRVVASYVPNERIQMLKQLRGDSETFAETSKRMRLDEDSLIAKVARSRTEMELNDAQNTDHERVEMARQFNVNLIRFVPAGSYVLEYGAVRVSKLVVAFGTLSDKELRQKFDEIDTERSGTISAEKITFALRDPEMVEAGLDEILSSIEPGQNLSFEDFRKFVHFTPAASTPAAPASFGGRYAPAANFGTRDTGRPSGIPYMAGDDAQVLRSDGTWCHCTVMEVAADGLVTVSFEKKKKQISVTKRLTHLRAPKKVEFTHVVREWRLTCRSGGTEIANGVLHKLSPALKAVNGMVSVERLVGSDGAEFKVRMKVEASKFAAWETDGYPPEVDFMNAVKAMPEITNIEVQTITSETM